MTKGGQNLISKLAKSAKTQIKDNKMSVQNNITFVQKDSLVDLAIIISLQEDKNHKWLKM